MAGPSAALPLVHDYLDGESLSDAVTGALVTALDGLAAEYGSADPADWLQPIEYIEWSPLGIGTVPDTIWMNRGTYNQIVSLGSGLGSVRYCAGDALATMHINHRQWKLLLLSIISIRTHIQAHI